MSKRKQKSLDEIYYGVEPHAEDERDKGRCMNWYNYMSDNKSCVNGYQHGCLTENMKTNTLKELKDLSMSLEL